jgi:hypothetical protein
LIVSRGEIRVDANNADANRADVTVHMAWDLAWDYLFKRVACKLQDCRFEDYRSPGHICLVHAGRQYAPHEKSNSTLEDHCFSPLVDWVNGDLKSAYWLLLSESITGDTWACLQEKSEPEPESEEDGTSYLPRQRLYRRRGR